MSDFSMSCRVNSSGKAGTGLREIAPVEGDGQAGDLPVAGRRILASGGLVGCAKEALCAMLWVHRRAHRQRGEHGRGRVPACSGVEAAPISVRRGRLRQRAQA